MLSTSQQAPGYRFQNHVPPTPDPASKTWTDSPSPRSRCSAYSPANPAPTTTTSTRRGDPAAAAGRSSVCSAGPGAPPPGAAPARPPPGRGRGGAFRAGCAPPAWELLWGAMGGWVRTPAPDPGKTRAPPVPDAAIALAH